jgi:DNA-binding beta-propeller fold protein YncE
MGWRIRPAGTQVKLGNFPLGSAVSPDGKFLLVVNAGQPASISVLRTDTMAETSRVPVASAWQGIAFSSDAKNVYVGSGARNTVFEFTFSSEGVLTPAKEMAGAATGGFIGDIAIPRDGRMIFAADLMRNEILVINPQSGRVIQQFKTARRPYQILFHPDGKSFFVSSWADASVVQHNTDTGEELTRTRVAPHPTGMAISDRRIPDEPTAPPLRLFVAAANTNDVFVLGVDGSKIVSQLDVLNVGFGPGMPAGMTPSALALSADQTQLFVACSNVNAVAVADISDLRSRLTGFIPTGAYPSSLRTIGNRLVATNAHSGSATVLPLTVSLATVTDQAIDLVAYDPAETAPKAPPVENVILVTFDANIGSNFAKLAKGFGTAINFYPNAPRAEGVDWALSGLPSDFVQRMRGNAITANDPANLPPVGTLLLNARQAGLTTGEFGPAMPQQLPAALPRFTLIRLNGTDADRNLGRVAETLSKSGVWTKTVMIVLAENSPLLLVSPYTRTAPTPTGMFYNHSSVLRTIELILKLRPLTVFDASARPLTDLFSATANTEPFNAEN